MASFHCYDNSHVIATLIITNFNLYLIQLWSQFFQMFLYGDVVYAQTWQLLTVKNCIELLHMPVRPGMLLHRMALVFVRLFCKTLGKLQEFFGQMVYRQTCKKLPVRLTSHEKPIRKWKSPGGTFTFGLLNIRASSRQFLKSGAPGTHNSMLCELY